MEDNTSTTEKVYTTKEVATLLDIAIPTVRKYAQILEKHSYRFMRNEAGNRLFVLDDINAFKHLVELRKADVSVETSAKLVAERFKETAIQVVSSTNTEASTQYIEQYARDMSDIKETINKQNDLIKALSDKLDQQTDYIKSSIDKRDALLMDTMNKLLGSKKNLSEPAETTQKRNWFKRLFK